ncbi:MAG: hypothetical protein ACLQDL_08510 [Spirochaetia bacterium]
MSKLRKRAAAAAALAVFLAASAHALTTDLVGLAGIETPPQGQDATAAQSKGKGYAEAFLGGGASLLNNGWYTMTDEDGYDNIYSLAPSISTGSVDAVIGITYYWPFKSRFWWGAGFKIIYPFLQSLNGATTEGGSLAFGVGPGGQIQPSNWFTAPTIFSFDAPFRIALTPDVLITLTPSLLGAVIYDNVLDVTYFGIGASGSVGVTWYFSERFGTSASVGYRYIYAVSDTYAAPFPADTMYNTYGNYGFFGMAGLAFRF